jgi:hypothetical protein
LLAASGVLAAMLLLAGNCYDPPVTETLSIRLLPDDRVLIGAEIRLQAASKEESNEALAKRLRELERSLVDGRDGWAARFEAVEPDRDRRLLERDSGSVVRAAYQAMLPDPAKLRDFFSGTPIFPRFQRGDTWAELCFDAGPPSRATPQEIRRFQREKASWVDQVAAHLSATAALYRYLEDRPDRARDCLGAYFGDFLDKPTRESLGGPTAEENGMLEAMKDARVADMFAVPDGQAYSLDEMAQRIHDPFPAPIHLTVPGRVLDSEGFQRLGETQLAIPAVSLWNALTPLTARWLEPDPLVAVLRYIKSDSEEPFDLDDFLSRPRAFGTPPRASEIGAEVDRLLTPPDYYRVRWSSDTGSSKDGDRVWRELAP